MNNMKDFEIEDGAFTFLLGTLTETEQSVLKLCVGVGENKPLSLEEAGVALDLSLERVRQILARVLRKLRHPSRVLRLSKIAGVSLDDLDLYKNLCEEVFGAQN